MSTMAETFTQKLTNALENLAQLEIITAVGVVNFDAKADRTARHLLAPDAKIMRTSIDLLQGDITTQMDPAFTTGELQALRDFHGARELQGAAIIKANVDTLSQILSLALRLSSDKTGAKL